MTDHRPVEISTNSIIAGFLVFGGALALWALRDVVVLLGLCVVLAAALHPLINRLEHWGVPRPAGILTLYAILLAISAVVVMTFTPVVAVQLQQLAVTLVHLVQRSAGGTAFEVTVSTAILNLTNTIIHGATSNAWRVVTTVTIGSQWALIGAILVYELVVDHGSFRRTIAHFIPVGFRQAFLVEGARVERRLSLWLRGMITVGAVIAVLAGVGLTLLHVKYALVLALIAGLSEFIPLVGPYIAMLPAAAVGFSISPLTGGLVVLLYYGIQQIENNFIAPKVVSQAVGLRPVTVFLAILVGAHVAGVLGIIFAVPSVILIESLIAVIRSAHQPLSAHG